VAFNLPSDFVLRFALTVAGAAPVFHRLPVTRTRYLWNAPYASGSALVNEERRLIDRTRSGGREAAGAKRAGAKRAIF
jgi:hypothetical protein